MISVHQLSKQIASLCPEDHLRSFLEENTRPDGRKLDERRPVVLAKKVVGKFKHVLTLTKNNLKIE